MSSAPDNPNDRLLASLLVAYDEALGDDTPPPGLPESVLDENRDLAARFSEARACLELLNRVRRLDASGSTSPAASEPAAQTSHSDDERPAHPWPATIGRFQIEREIGRGGLGIVLLARDPQLGRQVAIKIPRQEIIYGDDARRRFVREAEAAARLSHPHIVALHEVQQDGALCYLVSEYCNGPSLAQWLKSQSAPMATREAALLIERLALAVHHAHSRGVLHRDIKPGNIVLETDESAAASAAGAALRFTPKLTDFGMAKLLESAGDETTSGMIVGTVAYMPPEQAEGRTHDLDSRADVYSLGAVMYELLTGTAPYRGKSDLDTLRQLLVNEPVRPRLLRSNIPADLEAITLKCLAKDPAGRYATAQHLAEDLHRYLAGQPTVARPAGALVRIWKWARRRPALAALLGVLCAAAVGLMAVITVYNARLGAALDDARRLLYATDMQLAFDAWHGANAGMLEERLSRYQAADGQTDLRTFPWYFLNRQRYGDQTDLYSHADTVFAVAWSPRGDLIASGSADGVIQLWDVAAGKIRRKLLDHHGTDVNNLAFSHDGRWLASCGDDLTIRVWEIDGADKPRELKLVTFRDLNTIAFSPDGKWLAAGGEDKKTRLWNTSDWKLARVVSAADATVNRIAFSPDSQLLAITHSSGAGSVVRVETGEPVSTLVPGVGREYGMGAVAFSHDGRQLATASFKLQEVDFWDPLSGERLKTIRSEGNWLQALAFTPDDQRLLTAHQDGGVRVWDVATGEPQHVLLGHSGALRDLAIAPDGSRAVSVGVDRAVKLWNLSTIDQRLACHRSANAVRYLAFSPRQNLLAIDEFKGMLRLIDTDTGQQLFEARSDQENGNPLATFSPDGQRLVYAVADGCTIELLDVASRKPLSRIATPSRFRCAAISPSSNLLATGDDRGRLTIWDATTSQKLRAIDTAQRDLVTLTFLPDGNRLVVCGNIDVRVWDISLSTPGTLFPNCPHKVWQLSVSPDHTLLAAATTAGEILLWSLPDLQFRASLVGHRDWSNSISFAPDGQTLASASNDGTVRLWDVRTLQQVGVLVSADQYQMNAVSFSPDGKSLAAGAGMPSEQGALYTWSVDKLALPLAPVTPESPAAPN